MVVGLTGQKKHDKSVDFVTIDDIREMK